LSPYVNAFWFRIFGVGLRSLVAGNFLVLCLFVPILYAVLNRIADRWSATCAGVVFVLLFAFGEYGDVGNFNFITPYSHELVHGVVLSFGAIYGLFAYLKSRRSGALFTAGGCLGLVFLTKPEVFAAASVALLVGGTLAVWSVERTTKDRVRRAGATLLCALLPVVVAAILLSRRMPWRSAIQALIGPYRHLGDPAVAALPFYSKLTGFDAPAMSALSMVGATTAYLALFSLLAASSFIIKRRRLGAEAAMAAGVVLFAAGVGLSTTIANGVARAFPLLLAGVAVVLARSLLKQWPNPDGSRLALSRLTLTLFSGVLLVKVLLNVRFYRYGFALAMPATMVVILALTGWIPEDLNRRGGDGAFFRTAALICISIVALIFLLTHQARIAKNTYVVGDGPDRFLADSRALPVTALLGEIQARLALSDRLVVLPEGVMVNYLARRTSSVPYLNFLPPELVMFGETQILDALSADPPEYVAIVDRPMGEYGLRGFGINYAQEMLAFVRRHYATVTLIPGAPIEGPSFGVELLKRHDGDR
jgi:hypothetical protein